MTVPTGGTTRMRVPLLDLRAQYESIREEILDALARVCESQRFVLGPEVEALEETLAERLGVRHAIGVSSGTDALLVALMAADVGPGDEVVVPTYSFFATAGSVARLGAVPVFVDVDPDTFNLTADAVATALSPRTRAVVPVHLFGQPVDMDPLVALARDAGIRVVEDACQAIGARDGGRCVGGLGDLGCFSFYPTKNLGGLGDGGLVTTDDDALADRVRLLRVHGMQPVYYHRLIGGNFRLDALQAAALRVKARYLDQWTEARRRNAGRYARLFEETGLRPHVTPPAVRAGGDHVYHQYVIRIADRDRVRAHLAEAGIGTEIYYPVPLHAQECFEGVSGTAGSFPVADAAARDTLALPIYAELTEEQQRAVVGALASFFGR